MRTADIRRDTRETRIQLSLNLDGTGKADIATGVGFLDHMLELFARHGDFDLTVRCQGDTQVDGHHSVEDIGICLGRAFAEALGDKRGITRYGQFLLPMDETLVLVALIPAFAPAANVVAQFSQIYDLDAKYAGLINAVTMLLCIVTMPLLVAVYQM